MSSETKGNEWNEAMLGMVEFACNPRIERRKEVPESCLANLAKTVTEGT